MDITIRPTRSGDTDGIARMLTALTKAGKRTRPSDPDYVARTYVANPAQAASHVATDADGRILGLQILLRALPGNEFGTPEGWASIGTHVAPDAGRQGIGRRLFAETLHATENAGFEAIEAAIGDDNADGLAYYEAIGFRTWRTLPGRTCKRYDLAAPVPVDRPEAQP